MVREKCGRMFSRSSKCLHSNKGLSLSSMNNQSQQPQLAIEENKFPSKMAESRFRPRNNSATFFVTTMQDA